MKAAAYIRVSSRAQDHATQRAAIERAAKTRGDRVGVWYAEKRSARTMARPELERLRSDARKGRVQRLYVFRVDRLTRSGIRDTFQLVEELRDSGVEIVTTNDGFSLTGPVADVVLAVMAWGAQMELLAMKERISAARARIESAGGQWGRRRRVDGVQGKAILKLHAKGQSVRAIAVTLKIPRMTVHRTIQRAAS